ncbi:MAG: TlyA family RNA methyltransferase [Dehalococcoidia bacterium]|nr:TlyA family RNA methyltransferase [Dehalococcoidia bacterium]
MPTPPPPATGRRPARNARPRLDDLLVERGLAADRAEARALVLARAVLIAGAPAAAAAAHVDAGVALSLRERGRYASRGGEKLAGALERCAVSVEGARCLDAGASAGGFTDCLLQRGASHVTAVDVAYGALAPHLRADLRVTVLERTNVRLLAPLQPSVDLAVLDLSFISLTAVLPAVLRSVRPGGDLLALVKPQFEAARAQVPRGGVVEEATVHASAVARVALWAINAGLRVRGVIRSPLLGPSGNREFFLWLRRP